ncbi:hypothetical protein [Nocardia sp. NPDC058666]|uniref:hypothetical protein n=1 Tax=Nocardia sp. NPDC058666 TaxID=3346587 RepID=UPI003652F829
MTVVELRRVEPGLLVIGVDGAPLVTDGSLGLDVLVLEVVGGHLSWVLDGGDLPAAVLDDVEAAQDWVWAVYGEAVALAVSGIHPQSLTAVPARPELVVALRRLAYAHWASRWWPASTIDGIASLDARLLSDEIESLSETCEMVLGEDGDVPHDGAVSREVAHGDDAADTGAGDDGITSSRQPYEGGGSREGVAHLGSRGRADDYALAAGGSDPVDGLTVARGSGGWDWRRCPPGILDASEHAVSWLATRAAGVSTVQVNVVAAPDCRGAVPEHLRPFARVRSVARSHSSNPERGHSSARDDHAGSLPSAGVEIALLLRGDVWTGTAEIPGTPDTSLEVTVFVPAVGPANPVDDVAAREQVRGFARRRLGGVAGAGLDAEVAAAESDEDF